MKNNLQSLIQEYDNDKIKICPIMSQGWLSNPKIAETEYNVRANSFLAHRLPKCLEEKCAIWCKNYNKCSFTR